VHLPELRRRDRLVGTVLIDMHDEWVDGDRRYLPGGSMAKLCGPATEPVAPIESGDVIAPGSPHHLARSGGGLKPRMQN
jgi:hypothetical protein